MEIKKEMKEMALWLLEQGCSIIPLTPKGKKPCAELLPCEHGHATWVPFQKQAPTREDVERWFNIKPNINIGLVTGEVSGVVAIDVDGLDGQEWFRQNFSPIHKPLAWQKTSAEYKFHAFYKNPKGIIISCSTKGLHKDIDVRGDGGYVVIAPSIHPKGMRYKMSVSEEFTDMQNLSPLPTKPFENTKTTPTTGKPCVTLGSFTQEIPEGARNTTLTSWCGSWVRKKLSRIEVLSLALTMNNTCCKPPLEKKQVETIVDSVFRTNERNNSSVLRTNIIEWIKQQGKGYFSIGNMFMQLNVKTAEDKESMLMKINELKENGNIEQNNERSDLYRNINCNLIPLDIIKKVDVQELQFLLPLGLQANVVIQPKNIILIAGETNAGKTSFLFNLMVINRYLYKFNYITTEMTVQEIQAKIDRYGLNYEEFSDFCTFTQCTEDYFRLIQPDGINIIDYLEKTKDFATIADDIRKIFERLTTGVAFITIQKKSREMFGRGGEFSLEKARLAISLFTHGRLPNGIVGSAKITKCKNFREGRNPEGREYFYQLINGTEYILDVEDLFSPMKRYFSEKERIELLKRIETYCVNQQSVV